MQSIGIASELQDQHWHCVGFSFSVGFDTEEISLQLVTQNGWSVLPLNRAKCDYVINAWS